MKKTQCLLAATLLLASPLLHAQARVSEAWVRGTVAAQQATGAFMQLKSPVAMRLVSAASPAAGLVEMHEMKLIDGVMRMRAVDGINLPAGKTVELKPGGLHIMLMDLKTKPLLAGQFVELTLVFEGKDKQRQTVVTPVPVRALGAAAPKAASAP